MFTLAVSRSRLYALVMSTLLAAMCGLAGAAPAAAIDTPSGFHVVAVSARSVALAWNPRAGVDGYRVQFSPNSDMSKAVSWTVKDPRLEWNRTDLNPMAASLRLSPDTTYYFRVKGIAADKTSLTPYSAVLKARTGLATGYQELAPREVAAVPVSPTSLSLTWTSPGPGFRYRVRYGVDPNVTTTTSKSVIMPAAGGVITGLKADTDYYVKVRVIDALGVKLSGYSAVKTVRTREVTSALAMVTYNVLKASSATDWAARRLDVAAAILAQRPDVVALQEATPITVAQTSTGSKIPQYADLISLLGSRYSYVTTAGTSGTRLAYNMARLTVVRSGSQQLEIFGPSPRYAVWAVLADKITGKRVFVITTHLEPGKDSSGESTYWEVRVRQARQVLALIAAKNTEQLPVLLAGDLNSSRSTKPSNGPYNVLVNGGMIDPLGNASGSWLGGNSPIAEHVIDLQYNSYNGMERRARRTVWPLGTHVDYLMVSRGVAVPRMQMGLRLDQEGYFLGTIPSDHNLISALVQLP